jgi:hypothetical protein
MGRLARPSVKESIMLQESIAVRHPVCIFSGFYQVDLAASQVDVQLGISGSDNEGKHALKDGYIIGISGTLSAAATAGSLTIGATIDGTEQSGTTQTVTTAQEFSATFNAEGGIPFNAGQQIGVEITTDGSWDGLTADLDVDVYVVYRDWDF